MSHTPGPWKAENLDDEPYGRIAIHTPGAGRSIAVLWQDDAPVPEWNAEQWANARLIAAAPDMLAALRTVAADDCVCDAPWMEAIRAAIAKAEGKS